MRCLKMYKTSLTQPFWGVRDIARSKLIVAA